MLRCFRITVAVLCLASMLAVAPAADDREVTKPDGLKADAAKPDGPSRSPITSLPRIAPAIHESLQSQQFAEAVKLIDAELKGGKVGSPDYLMYLKGRAQTELASFDDAIATFGDLEEKYAKSNWAARARFGRADVAARQRNYRAAGEIYLAEAERLLSAGRRDELTGIYLEFADRHFDGIAAKDPSQKKQPDYKNALTWYSESLKLQPSLALRQKIEFRIARSQQELALHGDAINSFAAWMQRYAADKTPKNDRAPAAIEVEARFHLGRAQLAGGHLAEARKTWQDFLTSAAAKDAGGELIAEAQYKLASTYGIPTPGSVGEMELGIAALEKFLKAFPKHALAAKAELETAQSYVHHGRFEQAAAKLKALIANEAYAKTDELAEARRLLGQSYYSQKKFPEAIAAWKEFLDQHPNNAKWSEVQTMVIDAEFQIAAEHARKKDFAAARGAWETFLNKYPLDSRAPGILFRFGQMKYAEAVALRDAATKEAKEAAAKEAKDPANKAEVKPDAKTAKAPLPDAAKKLLDEAIADWERLVSKYPGSNEASQAAFSIGVTLEDQLARLPEALEAYRKVPGGWNSQAQQRIANLTAKQLEVVTERKFRTNEKPEIVVHTRNVEQVVVKVYRIDMLDYFRKMHLATGVESLDIALIDPDKTWTHSVADYEKFRRHENRIAVPIDGPGVTAVTVTGEKLEATTMLVVSDLDLIVKSSRNELFVFVENMLTGKPAEGVSLLVSDGAKVFAEAVTNKDGLLQKSYDELKSVDDLRVFATMEGHSASSVVSLSGLDFAVGLAAKGYLWTDRPAYRAGQLVNLKGVIRWVENDRFTFKPGEKYQLDVYDSRGRVLHTSKVALGEFGTFAANFALPESAAQGDYRVHLHQPGKEQSYETSFQVHEIKLEPIHLTIDVGQKVFFRGEKIAGKVKLAYYYGAPLAGRSVQFRLADDRVHTETTNSAGEVSFEFETARYSESQPLVITAHHAERGLNAAETVFLATRGFAVGVNTLRPVYIAGETFDATAAVADPAGKPVETPLKVEVFEETRQHGERGEKLVATHEIKTDKEGKARQTLKLDEPGRYLLRATGTDRFNNPVSGQWVVQISGDEDKVRLRILAEQHHYKVGDTARLQLHWREAPALALVTFEGARILGYRLVELKTGANALDLPIDAQLAPNFDLAVAVMEHNRFHQARSEFRVTRKLNIALKPKSTTLKPGDELKVDVTVTDPQGNPVSAEVTLGLIQRNVLDIFGERQPAIDEFFGGGLRVVSVRAGTSATFQYAPSTRGVSEALLAEADRAAVREMEKESAEELAKHDRARIGGRRDNLGSDRRRFQPQHQQRIAVDALQQQLEIADSDMDDVTSNEFLGIDQNGNGTFGQMVDGPGPGVMPLLAGTTADFANGPAANNSGDLPVFPFYVGVTERSRNQSVKGQAQLGGMGGVPTWGQPITGTPLGLPGPQHLPYGGQAGLKSHTVTNNTEISHGWAKTQLEWNDFDVGAPVDHFMIDVRGKRGPVPVPKLRISSRDFGTADGRQLLDDLSNADGTVLAINGRGEVQVINGLPAAAVQAIAREGLELISGQRSSETGYWNPVLVTDKEGKAQVAFRIPDRSTAWKLRAKGIDASSLAGQAEVEVISKKDLFSEFKTPLALVEGDDAHILVEVHNSVVKKDEEIEVVLKSTINGKEAVARRTLVSKGPGIEELTYPIDVAGAEAVQLELTLSSGDHKDTATTTIPVRPYGTEIFTTASGRAAQNTLAFVGFDKALKVQRPKLELVIGPNINRTLLDAVFGSQPAGAALPAAPGGIERSVADVLGGVALLKTIRDSSAPDSPEAQTLGGRLSGAVATLVSAQREDGSWSWTGGWNTGRSDRFLTSRVMWALAEARRAGFAVPQATWDNGVQALNKEFTQSVQTDREGQAILLHGLAEAGAADFAHANRLYRDRNLLSASGLLHVALVLVKLDRKEMALEMLKLVELPSDAKARETASGGLGAGWSAGSDPAIAKVTPWMQSPVELRAMLLLALQDCDPASAKASDVSDWLMAARVGSRWAPEKANGPAVAALARWFARTKVTSEKYALSVFVNDKLVEKIDVDPSKDASRRLEVAEKFLVAGKPQKVNFDLEGRGQFSYSALLSGFVAAEDLKNTATTWHVERHYEPAQRSLDGELIPRGFNILSGGYNSFRNPLTQLPMGERGEVTVRVWRSNYKGTPDEQLDYLVVTEPVPAGTMVLTESVTGAFERYELSPGAITFYLGDKNYGGDIKYSVVGYLPGDYKASRTLVRSFYRPERIAVSAPMALTVLARGEKSRDEYRLTPVEMFELGKRYAAKGDFKQADEHLTKLFKDHRLEANVYAETVKLLFKTSLALDKKDAVVEYFEIIKEKFPDVEIDYESILKVAKGYHDLGEYERSYLVYRATIEASFGREGQITGFLDGQGQFARSVQVMERLLREYPSEAYVAVATYALAQEVFGKAAEAANNAQLREAKITRVDLIAANIHMLDHFLGTWPKDPAADQAAFAMANSHLELEQYALAIARCRKSCDRYPGSKLLDSFWYIIGFSQFSEGKPDDALATCRKVAEMTRKDPNTGIELAAANREQAIYIMGQVFHSLGKPAEAIGEYERVKTKFPDATEAIDFFTRKEVKLPEVTTVKPGDAAKVPLEYRNVPAASVKVYRIDLLKFGLMQRNLDRITAINLAGIRPYHELTASLGDGKDFRDRTKDLELPLKEEGAYLVVCRAENLYASGLVLVSPLVLEPQEDAQSGRVRVTVKDAVAGKYVHAVHVKVIGTHNPQFNAGETDLRGIFTADGICGTTTVIAKSDQNRYAFYRGKTFLGQRPEDAKKPQSEAAPANANPANPDGKGQLLENLRLQNGIFNNEQRGNYRQFQQQDNGGVKAKAAF